MGDLECFFYGKLLAKFVNSLWRGRVRSPNSEISVVQFQVLNRLVEATVTCSGGWSAPGTGKILHGGACEGEVRITVMEQNVQVTGIYLVIASPSL